MTAILRLQLDDKDPVRVNSAINQLAESYDRNARSRLTSAATFYVSPSGSDSNSGSQTSPFLTIQHAYDTIVANLDTAGFTVTIQLADGTYTSGLAVLTSWSGGGSIVLNGNASTPSNVLISTSGECINIFAPTPSAFQITNLKVTSSGNNGIVIRAAGLLVLSSVICGACAGRSIVAVGPGATIQFVGPVTISGNAGACLFASFSGGISCNSQAFTLTGPPSFTFAFAQVSQLGILEIFGVTFTGTATGVRYLVDTNGVINTNGAGTTFLPGSSIVAPSTGGQYI